MSFLTPPVSPPSDDDWFATAIDDGRVVIRHAPPLDGDWYSLEGVTKVPVLDSIAPDTCAVGDVVSVTASGDFPPDARVLFNGGPALSMASRSETTIVFSVDASGGDFPPTPGTYDVQVTSLNGTSAAVPFT